MCAGGGGGLYACVCFSTIADLHGHFVNKDEITHTAI